MDAEKDFDRILFQIKAELSSVGRLDPGPKPRRGINVIVSAELPAGWLGISDNERGQAFGPAKEMLQMVQSYVRRVVAEGMPASSPSGFSWELTRDFPWNSGQSQEEG